MVLWTETNPTGFIELVCHKWMVNQFLFMFPIRSPILRRKNLRKKRCSSPTLQTSVTLKKRWVVTCNYTRLYLKTHMQSLWQRRTSKSSQTVIIKALFTTAGPCRVSVSLSFSRLLWHIELFHVGIHMYPVTTHSSLVKYWWSKDLKWQSRMYYLWV